MRVVRSVLQLLRARVRADPKHRELERCYAKAVRHSMVTDRAFLALSSLVLLEHVVFAETCDEPDPLGSTPLQRLTQADAEARLARSGTAWPQENPATALGNAAISNDLTLCHFLVEKAQPPCPADGVNGFGASPLIIAARYGYSRSVRPSVRLYELC